MSVYDDFPKLDQYGREVVVLSSAIDNVPLPVLITGGSGGGDASAANQLTEITKLTSIDGKTPALGQALAAGSVPVVLTAAQISTLTPPAAITGFATESTLSAMSSKLPASIGQTTRLNSLSVTIASDQTVGVSISGTPTVDTELPAAATPADADTNGTLIPAVLSRIQGYNGSTWDRVRTGAVAITSTVTGYMNNLPFGEFLTSPGTLTNAQFSPLMLDANRNLKVSNSINDATNSVLPVINKKLSVATYCPSTYRNAGAANGAVIKASAGNLFSFACHNKNAALAYIQFWDTIVGAGSGTLIVEFFVPGLSQIIVGEDYFSMNGIQFSSGICFGYSTSSNTFTGGTASDQNTQVNYK